MFDPNTMFVPLDSRLRGNDGREVVVCQILIRSAGQ